MHLFDATTFSLVDSFADPTTTTELNNFFGRSVAIDGSLVLIGDPTDDNMGPDTGQAYLFEATTGALLHTFDDPSPGSEGPSEVGDGFGWSVAIDGNFAVIGAPGDDSQGSNVGQVHLFDASTTDLLHTWDDPTPTPTASSSDNFGWSVAIDGAKVIVGAPFDDTNGNQVGQAFLFDAVTGALLRTFEDPDPTPLNNFGDSVAISGDYALIGVPGDDTNGTDVGRAYLFDANTGSLIHTFDDPTPSHRVLPSGHVVGSDRFGDSVAMSGNLVLIGAPFDDTDGDNTGQAHLFDAISGELLLTINDPTKADGDRFGSIVDIDGGNLLIGDDRDDTLGNGAGEAHLFDVSGLLAV